MCQLNECAQPPCQCLTLQASEVGDTHVYFIRPMAPTPDLKPVNYQICTEIQQRVCLRKIHNVNWPTLWYGCHGFEQHTTNYATDQWCKYLCVRSCERATFLIFNLTAESIFVHFNVIVWWQLQQSWYCVEYIRFSPFLILDISQGSVATQLKCGEKSHYSFSFSS